MSDLATILKSTSDLIKNFEQGNIEGMHPDIKKAIDNLTPEQKAEFMQQAANNEDLKNGVVKLKDALSKLGGTITKVNGQPD